MPFHKPELISKTFVSVTVKGQQCEAVGDRFSVAMFSIAKTQMQYS